MLDMRDTDSLGSRSDNLDSARNSNKDSAREKNNIFIRWRSWMFCNSLHELLSRYDSVFLQG